MAIESFGTWMKLELSGSLILTDRQVAKTDDNLRSAEETLKTSMGWKKGETDKQTEKQIEIEMVGKKS